MIDLRKTLIFGLVLLAVATLPVGMRADDPADNPSTIDENVFNFVRIRYNGFAGVGMWGAGNWVAPWAHDYPRAEKNFLKILSEMTTVETTPHSYLILDLDDPHIMDYPVLYVSEPGYWNCTQAETDNLREYLNRGGFVIFDDFRDAPGEWDAFSGCMKQVFPDRSLEVLTAEHPVFHCFYDIDSLDMVPPYKVPGKPTFYGMSDPTGRLQVVANFNNDIGDYWEWSDQSWVPLRLSNEAYKFGINYIIYAMTH
jgi:hypothetical protein